MEQESESAYGDEAQWGKKWAEDAFGIDHRYYSFDNAGWHFIVLDSTFPHEKNTYMAKLDEEQFSWLAADLKKLAGQLPVCIVSHIPILSVALVEWSARFRKYPQSDVGASHQDAMEIVHLFKKHPNVKLCVSGHLHLLERIEYAGVTY